MQHNFILTDVMKTGNHVDLEQFINMHSLQKQKFDITGEYYTLHQYNLDSYDRKFAILDCRAGNIRIKDNPDFAQELTKRCKLLHSQGFVFIKANPWESLENIELTTMYPEIDLPHVKWTGGVSWFWFYMFQKHKDTKYNFNHALKNFDFLYLNKSKRQHRIKLYQNLHKDNVLDQSLYCFHQYDKTALRKDFELPWVDHYPFRGLDQDIYEKPYNDTKFNLVSETNDNSTDVFMTEKIWKPIIAEQVFIVHGNYLYLQKLKELGFKTFSNYFNESYDLEIDRDLRIEKIVQLCKELKNFDWRDMYLQTKGLRKHNKDLFFDPEQLSKQVNETLNIFLEFADSSQITP